MFGFIEALFTLLAALINACFPCTCGHPPADPEGSSPSKKRRRYSITETTTTTHTTTIESIGKSDSSPNLAAIDQANKQPQNK